MLTRTLAPLLQSAPKSVLLLGPRQTGKSTLIQSLHPDLTINFADESTFLEFARNPAELKQRLAGQSLQTIAIDEVQRLPSILNTIQALLDHDPSRYKFYLTGSSARKLRRGQANLLPGRVFTYQLGALTSRELSLQLNTARALALGTLPEIYLTENEQIGTKLLRSYASTYLKEEIQAEALSRNLEGFSRFLFAVATHSGSFLDLSKLASESQIPRQSALRYFEILEDTLLVTRCSSFSKNMTKRLIQHPRYFFFDTGVLNALLGNFQPSPDRVGNLFEHLIFNQILHGAFARDLEMRVSTYRTSHGAEVDFIVELAGEVFAIEVKHSRNIGKSDLRGLKNFAETYGKPHHPMILYLGAVSKVLEGIPLYPWQQGLQQMGL